MPLPPMGPFHDLPQSSSDPVGDRLEEMEINMVGSSQRLVNLDQPKPENPTEQADSSTIQADSSSIQAAAAAKTIMSSTHIGVRHKSKEFGYTDGEQLLRFAQSGRIIIFSIANEIFLLGKGILNEQIPPSQQQQQQPTRCTITDMPDELVVQIANFCDLNDQVCLALSNKHLAKSLSWFHTCPAGGLSIKVKWSPTTAVFKRQSLLKRLNCHQSSPRVRFCGKCIMLRPTDPAFWQKQWEGLDSAYQTHLYEAICSLPVIAVHDKFERILLAWQDGIPALEGSTVVNCPTCVAHQEGLLYDGMVF